MKITTKNYPKFIGFLIMFFVAGTLGWELIEEIIKAAGLYLNLTAGPVGFDIEVLAIYVSANPGSLLGIALGWFLFKRI
ncbi:MAG: hypothetical protein PQJ46_17200 [Spirochaetales bacterium]|nr:hypothetical protein [Spirochaetales bacterium]